MFLRTVSALLITGIAFASSAHAMLTPEEEAERGRPTFVAERSAVHGKDIKKLWSDSQQQDKQTEIEIQQMFYTMRGENRPIVEQANIEWAYQQNRVAITVLDSPD